LKIYEECLLGVPIDQTHSKMAKKDKKKAKQQDDYWDTEFQEDAAAVAAPTQEEPQNDAAPDPVDDLADEFGGLMSAIKKTKGKKGKKQQVEMVDANEELEALEAETPAETNGAAPATEENDEPEGGEFRVKTKKEKEKEKKEKEKAKKKAQVVAFTALTNLEGR
jgi:translation initiation factor 5B